jgi:hypothetical protein
MMGEFFIALQDLFFPLSLCPKEIIGKYNVVLIYPIKKIPLTVTYSFANMPIAFPATIRLIV